jgi:hypothetical protein
LTNTAQVQDEAYEHVLAMGFEVLQCFEEITNTPEAVGYIRPPKPVNSTDFIIVVGRFGMMAYE